jgi:hypothetical protein
MENAAFIIIAGFYDGSTTHKKCMDDLGRDTHRGLLVEMHGTIIIHRGHQRSLGVCKNILTASRNL